MLQALRELVIKGPFEHPGANAVEDENGRLVNLTQMSLLVPRLFSEAIGILINTPIQALSIWSPSLNLAR